MVTRLARKTPLKRRRLSVRVVKARCVTRGCTKTPLHLQRCKTHADDYLLKLRRPFVVKPGVCELINWHKPGGPLGAAGFPCSNVIQDNHGIDRNYTRGNLRWDPENGFSGCSSANIYAHFHGEEWRDWLRKAWGEEKYERLRRLSVSGPFADYDAALEMLTKEAQ